MNQSLDIYFNNKISKKRSYDINDFDISSFRGLSLEDGAATIIEYTIEILAKKIVNTYFNEEIKSVHLGTLAYSIEFSDKSFDLSTKEINTKKS